VGISVGLVCLWSLCTTDLASIFFSNVDECLLERHHNLIPELHSTLMMHRRLLGIIVADIAGQMLEIKFPKTYQVQLLLNEVEFFVGRLMSSDARWTECSS